MDKRLVLAVVALAVAASMVFASPTSSQPTLQTVFIKPDGSVYPDSAPIVRNGNTYTFTSDLFAAIKIQRSNVVLDGAGHTLSGPYNGTSGTTWLIGQGPDQLAVGEVAKYTIGVDLANNTVEGVTIKNLYIENFSIGMYLWTKNDTVTNSVVQDSIVGVLLSGSNQTVKGNIIAENSVGLFFGFSNKGDPIPIDIFIDHNDFERNLIQLSGCQCKDYNTTEPPHNWDDGKQGNFWSDYNGTDSNGDGVGDAAYTIDPLNQDRYPLVQSPVLLPIETAQFPVELVVLCLGCVAVAVVVFLVARTFRRKS
jgi:hypothetical protein